MNDVIDGMRADIARCGCPDPVEGYCAPCGVQVEAIAELTTLRARVEELEKDRERLDWIFADPFAVINVKGAYDYEEVEDREQLDAARASAGGGRGVDA